MTLNLTQRVLIATGIGAAYSLGTLFPKGIYSPPQASLPKEEYIFDDSTTTTLRNIYIPLNVTYKKHQE